jgi:hypothetical protein
MSKEKNGEKTTPETGKEKEKEKATQQQPVFAPGLEAFIEGMLAKCSKVKDPAEVRKVILKGYAGFLPISTVTKSLRMRSVPPMLIADVRRYADSFNVMCLCECILDLKFYQTSKANAIKDTQTDQADFDYFVSHISLDGLNMADCVFKLPDDFDDELAKARIPSIKRIPTQSSLGILVEQALTDSGGATYNNYIRKGLLELVTGKTTELEFAHKFSEFPVSGGIAFKKIINYIEKHHAALKEALKSGKPESKEIKADAEYLNIIQSIK